MPIWLVTIGKLLGSTVLTMVTSMLTGPMIEWMIWWCAEKLVKLSDSPWDDELIARMKQEREAAVQRNPAQ